MPKGSLETFPGGAEVRPPGPPAVDSLMRAVVHYGPLFVDPLAEVGRRFARYGDVYRVPGRKVDLFVVRDPALVWEILVTRGAAFGKQHSAFDRIRLALGDGLLTAEGQRWRRQRTLMQPAFARPRLMEYAEVMVEAARRTATELPHGATVSLAEVMTRTTLRIVAQTLFGEDTDDAPRIIRAMGWLNDALSRPDVLPQSWPSPTRLKAVRAVRDLDEAVLGLVHRRRAQVQRTGQHPADLLQRLLDARDDEGGGLSEREIRDQLVTLYLAGHETTANALSFSFYLLAQNPAARSRLQAELRRVLGGRLPTADDLPELHYTQQVVKEALRLYPPAYVIPRAAVEDTRLGPYEVPAGSELVVWSYFTHRLPRYYPDPLRFVPERFESGAEQALPKGAYVPFGAGQRACIGQVFAMFEAQLILAVLAQRLVFELQSSRPVAPKPGATLRPGKGLRATVVHRGL